MVLLIPAQKKERPVTGRVTSHGALDGYSLTRSAKIQRFSRFRKSGDQPGINDPGLPLLPPGGVMPPIPAKYGMSAPRWVNSARQVTNWVGIQSNVAWKS